MGNVKGGLMKKLIKLFISTFKDFNRKYERNIKEINKYNETMLIRVIIVGLIGISTQLVLSYTVDAFSRLRLLSLDFVILISVFLALVEIHKRYKFISVRALMHSFCAVIMAYAILLGTYFSSGYNAVFFFLLFILIPTVFIERMDMQFIILLCYILCFCYCSWLAKTLYMFIDDLFNSLVSLLLACGLSFSVTKLRIDEIHTRKIAIYASQHDMLTNMRNKRYLDAFLKEHKNSFSDKKIKSAVLIADIDDFKRYNDINGHLAGDNCLSKVAKKIKKVAIEHGFLCIRFGGEEFLLIKTDSNETEVITVGHDILSEVRNLKMRQEKNNDSYLTISIGAALSNLSDTDNAVDLINIADSSLYVAKGLGKNRIYINNYFTKE